MTDASGDGESGAETGPVRPLFATIDWGEEGGDSRTSLSRRTAAFVAVAALSLVALGYDLAGGTTIIPGLRWRLTPLDVLSLVTVAAVLTYLVPPLARNPRLARRYWSRFRHNRAAVAGLGVLGVVLAVGAVAPLVLPDPRVASAIGYQPPVGFSVPSYLPQTCVGPVVDSGCRGTLAHPLGTTRQGKDVLTLVLLGARVTAQIGVVAAALTVAIGTAVGTTAATAGGWVDELLMRYVDLQLTFPAFFLYLLLVYLFGGSLSLLVVVFGLTTWGGTARLVRSEALQRREEAYVTAARSAGAGWLHIVRRHVLPNVSGTVITNATLLVPTLILAEAGLAFLGLGDPAVPSWGQVIASGRGDLPAAWWISTAPGAALFVTVLAFNFVGDALRDALDPRVGP